MRMSGEQRRKQLLFVARGLFAERGFHATSMDEIAEAAGVTKPVLYQHFPNKRALYVELLTDTGAMLLQTLAEATTTRATGRERVEAGFLAYFRFVAEERAAFHLLFGTSIRTDPDFIEVVDQTVGAAADLIAQFIDIPASDEHRHLLASALVGMAEAAGRRASDGGEFDPARLAEWIAEFAWFGLRGVRAGEPSQLP
jgi:AcrR family transcriptional regulator